MVVLKGIRRNNLYYLTGSTVTGQAAISTDSDDYSTRLWHMRLEHIGEKSLQVLAKQALLKCAKPANWDFVNIVSLEIKSR